MWPGKVKTPKTAWQYPMTEVDTKTVHTRALEFGSVADCMAELDRIEAAEKRGELTTNGNWTAGQIMAHLASWIEYGYVGFPIEAPPFFVRWILKRMLKKMLKSGTMDPGSNIPNVEDGTFGQDDMETLAGIERFRAALLKMQSEPATYDSPAFGKVPDEVRVRVNLMHAQLHLGFLDYPQSKA